MGSTVRRRPAELRSCSGGMSIENPRSLVKFSRGEKLEGGGWGY